MTELFSNKKLNWSAEIVLEGERLRLEPLSLQHLKDLQLNLMTPHAWHSIHWGYKTEADIENLIQRSLQGRENGTANGFAMILQSTGKAVGVSNLMSFDLRNHYLEIGGTWIGSKWQKTFVNTEAKLLMLTHAFESLQCQRVEFRVDSLNMNSQRAVLRIGGKFEGELRQSCRLPDGRKRDYRVYSILDSEWSNLKKTLNWYLAKYV